MTRSTAYPSRARRPAYAREHALYPFAWRTPVVLVPGLHDSGPGHWQSAWQRAYPDFARAVQRDFASPDLDAWAATVARTVARAPAPPVIAAHSFGCLAVVRAVLAHGCTVAGALFVAPADPDRFAIVPADLDIALSFPSTLVASTNDPWLKVVQAGAWATRWGARLVMLPDAGHINAESGHTDWPEGFALLRDVGERAAAAGTVKRTSPAADDRRSSHSSSLRHA